MQGKHPTGSGPNLNEKIQIMIFTCGLEECKLICGAKTTFLEISVLQKCGDPINIQLSSISDYVTSSLHIHRFKQTCTHVNTHTHTQLKYLYTDIKHKEK